jgi:hypothetical protein
VEFLRWPRIGAASPVNLDPLRPDPVSQPASLATIAPRVLRSTRSLASSRRAIVADNLDVLTLHEACAFLRCGPKVLRRLVKLRRVPHRVLDRRGTLRFSRVALEAWLQNADGGAR